MLFIEFAERGPMEVREDCGVLQISIPACQAFFESMMQVTSQEGHILAKRQQGPGT